MNNDDLHSGTQRRGRHIVSQLAALVIATASVCTLATAVADTSEQNRAPRAHAGQPQTAVIGQTVVLDGARSTDPDGDRLEYRWTLQATPAGSGSHLSAADTPRAGLSVDMLGTYVAELVVFDGKSSSAASRVVISTGNSSPVAMTKPGGTVRLGDAVILDSSGSYDPDGDALTARWTLVERPELSRNAQGARLTDSARVTVDAAGDYVFELIVSDRYQDSTPVRVRYSTIKSSPRAMAGDDVSASWGTRVQLDGNNSTDADGRALAYTWSLLHAPVGSRSVLELAQSPRPTLALDKPGLYVAQLIVSDAYGDSEPATVAIDARPHSIALPPVHSAGGGGSDVDGDGVPDDSDNCVEHFNPDQRDTNGDGFGNICDADLDNDGFVTNTIDLGLLRVAFFSTPTSPNWNPDADFNGDNFINASDLGILRSFFFGPPGPIVNRFTNPAGGDWHDSNNWSLGIVPNTVHAVRIDLAPGMVVEYSAGNSEIANMRASSDFLLTGGDLSVDGTMLVDAPFAIMGGTLSNANVLAPPSANELVATGNGNLDSVTLASDMTINSGVFLAVQNNLTLSGATVTLESNNASTYLGFSGSSNALLGNGEVVFGGTATVDNRNQIYGNATAMHIGAGITIRSGTTGGLITSFSNALTLQGSVISNLPGRTMTVQPGPGSSLEGTMTASGGGLLIIDGYSSGGAFTLTSSANINVTDGDLDLIGPWTNEGQISVTNGVFDTGNNVNEEWDNNGTITLTNTLTELGGRVTLAGMGTFNTTGDVLLDGLLINTGESLDVATISGNFQLTTGEIEGGTIINTPLAATGNATLDGVTLATDFTVTNGVFLTVQNDLTLSGATVTLASNNSTTYLGFGGSSNALLGNGEVVFGGTATVDNRNQIYGNASSMLIDAGITVRSGTSGGLITSFANPLTLQGSVISNLSGRTVTVQPGPGSSLEGAMTASGGGHLVIDGYNTGAFTLAASSNINVTDGDLDLIGAWTNEGQISVTNGVFDTGNNVNEQWTNNGTITLTNTLTDLGGRLTFAGMGTFNTTGDVLLDGLLINTGENLDVGTISGNFQLTTGEIEGGTIVNTPLIATGNATLDGVTLATDFTVTNGVFLTVQNSLTLSGATVTLASNNSTTYLGFGGSSNALLGNGEVVFGGTTTADNRNQIYANTSNMQIGAGITVRSGTSGGLITSFANPLTLQGSVISNLSGRTVTVQPGPGSSLEGAMTASGGGHLVIDGYNTGAFTLAASSNINVTDGDLDLIGSWTNEGQISVTNGVFDTGNNTNEEWDNNGTITLTNTLTELGGRVTVAGMGTFNTTGDVALDGLLINTGENLDVGTISGNFQLTTGEIEGGTIINTPLTATANATLDGVTLATDFTVTNGVFLTVQNSLTLSGATVTLASNNSTTYLGFGGSSNALLGNGEVVFGGTATVDNRNQIYGNASSMLIDAGITVRSGTSGGLITSFANPLTLQGSVISNLSGRTVSVQPGPGSSLEGAMTASGGGHLTIDGYSSGGAFTLAASADVNVTDGNLDLFGAWINEGQISVTNGVFDTGNNVNEEWDNNGTITLTNTLTELGGRVTVDGMGTFNTTGDVLLDGLLINTGGNLDVGAISGNFQLTTGEIEGGTIINTPLSATANATLDGVTLATDLTIDNGVFLTVQNGLTLDGGTVTLASTGGSTYLGFSGAAATLGGTGEVLFGGTTTADNRNQIYGNVPGLTIGAGVTVRTDTAGGLITAFGNTLTIAGTIISNLAGREIMLTGVPITVEGTLAIDPGARIATTSANINLASGASLDVDLSPAGYGILESNNTINLDGTVNLTLSGGLSPAPCDYFDIIEYASYSGSFATVNGPDFGGSTFEMVSSPTGTYALTPGTCGGNLSVHPGATVTTSSDFSTTYAGFLAIDGVNATNSSWCTANNDPAPVIVVELPSDALLQELRITTSWSPTYDFNTGRFIARNAADAVVYDSGSVALTSGAITLNVVPDVAGVRSVEFVGETWNSIEPCLSEFEIHGTMP